MGRKDNPSTSILRRARHAKGVSLKEMAQRLKLSSGYLSRMETQPDTISFGLINAYEKELGLTRGSLISQDNDTSLDNLLKVGVLGLTSIEVDGQYRELPTTALIKEEARFTDIAIYKDLHELARLFNIVLQARFNEANLEESQLQSLAVEFIKILQETAPEIFLPPTIIGKDAIYDKAIHMIESLTKPQEAVSGEPLDNTIFIKMPMKQDMINSQWGNAIIKALQLGWNVVQLYYLDERDPEEHVNFITSLQYFLHYERAWGTGRKGAYTPYRLLDTNDTHCLLIVPTRGALLGIRLGQQLEEAIVFPQAAFPLQYSALKRWFIEYQQPKHSSELMKVVSTFSDEFEKLILTEERQHAQRLLAYKGELSTLTLQPETLADALREIWTENPDLTSSLMTYIPLDERLTNRKRQHQERRNLMHKRLSSGCHEFHIAAKSTIKNLLEKVGVSDRYIGVMRRLSKQDCIASLEETIYLLETYPETYHLGLSDDEISPVTFEIADNHSVMLATWRAKQSGEPSHERVNWLITEPKVVTKFIEHFDRLWEGPDCETNPETVKAWLREMIRDNRQPDTDIYDSDPLF